MSEISNTTDRPIESNEYQFRRWILAVLLGLATGLWFGFTTAEEHDRHLFFGLWRTRHFGMGLAGVWLTIAALLRAWSCKPFFSWLVCTAMIAVAFILLEVVGLVGLLSYSTLFEREKEVLGARAIPHLDVRGETFPDLASRWGYPTEPIPFHYQTDRRGFRNDVDRPDADIYMLGDSILVAGLLPFKKTVTGLLESEMGRTTMNISLIGLAPQEERDIFLRARLPLENRLVLHFVFEGNDLLDSARYRRQEQPGTPRESESFLKGTLTYNLLMFIQRLSDPSRPSQFRRVGRIGGKDFLFAWVDESFSGHEDELGHVFAALDDMRRAVTKSGGMYAVVFVPAKIRVLGPFCTWPEESVLRGYQRHLSPMRRRLREWCEPQGIALLDLTTPLIESVRAGKIPWFAGDTHPNAIGHRVATNAIKGWDVVTEWNSRIRLEE